MKKLLFLFSAFCLANIFICAATLYAQSSNRLPSFQMLLTNGKKLATVDLREDKPVLLIYFAPDCDHCQTLMKSFFKRISEFTTAQVLMVTFKPLNDVANFEKSYQTYKYDNLIVGSETQPLYLQQFYKLQNTPFVALYDKNKNLIFSYRKDASVDDLIKRLKQIK